MISQKKQILLVVLLFLIVFVLILFLVARPFLAQIKQAGKDLALQELNLEELNSQLASFEDFQKKNTDFQQYFSVVKDCFVDSGAPIKFMEFLENEAEILGVKLTVAALPLTKDPKFSSAFQITLEGKFSDTLRFLERLEESPWLVELGSLVITRFSETEQKQQQGQSQNQTEAEKPREVGDVTMLFSIKALSAKQVALPEESASKTITNQENSNEQ